MKTKQLYVMLFLLILTASKIFAVEVNDKNDVNAVVAGNTDFAFNLYGKLKDDSTATLSKGNLFFSPFSISTALAMTYGGARGETKKQMAQVLHFTLPDPNLYSAFGDVQKQLIQRDKNRGYQLLLANALWGQKGEPFLEEFIKLNNNYFGAGLNQLDFFNETEQSRQKINSWVEEKTKNKINNLIPPGGIDRNTELVLTNAIYFKGQWKTTFKKSNTEQADFTVSANHNVKVSMMHVKEKFKFFVDEKLQVLELPYKGNRLSMLVLLPREAEGLSEIENTLSAERLNDSLSKMRTTEVKVYFPKFKMTWGTFSFKNALSVLGMPDAFGNADFSGINGKKDLFISNVFHKAFIEVNEEGTEAAASTTIALPASIESKYIFRADHPFIFIIKDNRSGSILFMGRMMNPSE